VSQQIGSVLARTFREMTEKSNQSKRLADYNKISNDEITAIEQLLKKVDQKNFDLEKELRKLLGLNEEG
jgi:hypothetical protein